jgi:hypothetical protein
LVLLEKLVKLRFLVNPVFTSRTRVPSSVHALILLIFCLIRVVVNLRTPVFYVTTKSRVKPTLATIQEHFHAPIPSITTISLALASQHTPVTSAKLKFLVRQAPVVNTDHALTPSI